jgi:hypothetical protein
MSAADILAGRCRHLVPVGKTCSQCTFEAEGRELLISVSPFARKKAGNQKDVKVPLELMARVAEWLSRI